MTTRFEPGGTTSATPGSCDVEALAREHGRLVLRAAYRILGDAAQAEDVQQEVFLRLIETDRKGVASWPAFLTASGTRLAIDVLRRRQRWWALLPQWRAQAEVTAESPETLGIETEQATHLRQALARLSRREAQCFALRYLEGLDLPEVAAELRLTENNVGVILHRARRRLQAILDDTQEEVRA